MTMIPFRGLPEDSATPNWTTAADQGHRPRTWRRPAVLAWLQEARRRRLSRIYLWQLDDHTLKDIGITRAEAEWEANKWFWQQ